MLLAGDVLYLDTAAAVATPPHPGVTRSTAPPSQSDHTQQARLLLLLSRRQTAVLQQILLQTVHCSCRIGSVELMTYQNGFSCSVCV